MGFEKVSIPSEKELIISQLEGKIISGELPAGSRLPTERELAENMGVSKTVIHFALKELEQLKFLRCVPRHGTYVNDWTNNGNFETLGAVLNLQGINVDDTLKDSLIRMRNAIESDAMEMCSKYCTESDYEELQAAIDNLAGTSDDAGSEFLARLILKFLCFEQLQLDLIRAGKGAEAGAHIRQMYASFLNGKRKKRPPFCAFFCLCQPAGKSDVLNFQYGKQVLHLPFSLLYVIFPSSTVKNK